MDELNAAIEAAHRAGEILRAEFGRRHIVQFKGPIDVVTDVDRAVEDGILLCLRATTPEAGFLTEEHGTLAGTGNARWIIDPLDGTTNYAAGEPHFCTSIALERAGRLEIGVIYDPLRDEMYAARRSEGAWLNGEPIHVSTTSALRDALLSTGFAYDVWSNSDDNLVECGYFVKRARSLRSTGSAALDLAAVACGRRDAHWERGMAPYDIAAGILLVRQAGGVVTDYAGNADAIFSERILAANPAIHDEMLAFLRQRPAPEEKTPGR